MLNKIVSKFKLKDGREITFRYPKIEDTSLMAKYINRLSKEQTYIRLQGEKIPLKDEKEHLEKLIKKIKNKTAVQLLAFLGVELIAISDIDMDKGAAEHIGSFGITVAKKFRGLGIGKRIMQIVLDEATKNIPQLKIVILGVFSDNPIAQNLYAEMGFIKYGELPQGLLHKGHTDNYIYMYKKVKDL